MGKGSTEKPLCRILCHAVIDVMDEVYSDSPLAAQELFPGGCISLHLIWTAEGVVEGEEEEPEPGASEPGRKVF